MINKDSTNTVAAVLFIISALLWICTSLCFGLSFSPIILATLLVLLAFSLLSKNRIFAAISCGCIAFWFLISRFFTFGILEFVALVALMSIFIVKPNYATYRMWFMPSILLFAVIIYNVYRYFVTLIAFDLLIEVLIILLSYYLLAIGCLIAAYWATISSIQQTNTDSYIQSQCGEAIVPDKDSYCSLAMHVLLLLFTCGIWNLIWIYRTTDKLNCINDEKYRSSTAELLLCMFIPFYSIYWTYKTAQRIEKILMSNGIYTNIVAVCLAFAFFIPIIPAIIIQEKINHLVSNCFEQNFISVKYTNTNTSAADELKKFKELLDCGAITKEEYDYKKSQLLGL